MIKQNNTLRNMKFKVVLDDGISVDNVKFGKSVPLLLNFDTTKLIGEVVLHNTVGGIIAHTKVDILDKLHSIIDLAPTLRVKKGLGDIIESAEIISVSPVFSSQLNLKKKSILVLNGGQRMAVKSVQ